MQEICKDNCPLVPRVEALEEANKQNGDTHRRLFDKIGKLETYTAVQEQHFESIDEKLDELSSMVKELTGKSGRRWDSLVDKLIYLVAGAVVAWIAAGAPGLGN